jgi:hypothetical protein
VSWCSTDTAPVVDWCAEEGWHCGASQKTAVSDASQVCNRNDSSNDISIFFVTQFLGQEERVDELQG